MKNKRTDAATAHWKKVTEAMKALRPKLKAHFRRLKDMKWNENRKYNEYANFYKECTGRKLISDLKSIYQKKRAPLKIVDDGAGNGFLLSTLKEILLKYGIPCITVAMTLKSNYFLDFYKKHGFIDRIETGAAEFKKPEIGADVIFSITGSVNYTLPEIRKNHVLKLAHSLGEHGFLFITFGFETDEYSIKGGLSSKPKRAGIDTLTYFEGIRNALKKQGFESKFHAERDQRLIDSTPNWSLVVTRQKTSQM